MPENADALSGFVRKVAGILKEEYANYEIVIVNDGTMMQGDLKAVCDELLDSIECLRFLVLSRTFGEEIAYLAGMESSVGDYVVLINAELDPPELIPEIVDKCRKGSGVLLGRLDPPPERGPLLRLGSYVFHVYCRKVLKMDFVPFATGFNVLSRAACNAITRIKDRVRYLRFLSLVVGYQPSFFSYHTEFRARSRQGNLLDAFNRAIDIAVASGIQPLRFVSMLGLIASVVNMLYAFYVVLTYIFRDDVAPGWTTQSLQMSAMFFMMSLILAVMAEYVGRALRESQMRPPYFVMEEKNSRVQISDESRLNVVRVSE